MIAEIMPTAKLSPNITKTCLIPKDAREIYKPNWLAKYIFTNMQPIPDKILANTTFISEIAKTSIKNIFKISLPLAPSALKIPISTYLDLIEEMIIFENIAMLNSANTPDTIKNRIERFEKKSPLILITEMAVLCSL